METSNKQIYTQNLTRRQLLKNGIYGGLALGLPSSLWVSSCGTANQQAKKPNIFLITVDTLRADRLGCYGYRKQTSPNIDEFAAESLLFKNCLAHAPETRGSFASMLTGFWPHETRIAENPRLNTNVETIAEVLQLQGYKTVGVISNYVLRKGKGFDQGFMIYDDSMQERELVRAWPERVAKYTTNRAIELLKEFQKENLFMWIHYQDPHGPYTPPPQFARLFLKPGQEPRNLTINTSLSGNRGIPSYQRLGTNSDYHYYVSQYDGEIRYQDDHFKRLIDALKQLGFYDDSLIIFTSDHGEGMGEHEYYFAHGENLYNHQLHVPFILRYGKKLVGKRKDFVQHVDLVPTILNVLGVSSDSKFRGQDLLNPQQTPRPILSESWSPLVDDGIKFAITLNGLKLIHTPMFKQYELFDITSDSYEEHNLVDDAAYKKQLADLKLTLRQMREDLLNITSVKKPSKLTKEEIEKLKSLGYVR